MKFLVPTNAEISTPHTVHSTRHTGKLIEVTDNNILEFEEEMETKGISYE